ncbi:MAG: Fic family protein [Christensenellaceae bacterium]|jgi:Fic family protein|nr:Fic family protein [Christensenellaceae bacterium]
MLNRSGTYKTNLSGEAEYKSFCPTPLPPNPPLALDDEAIELLIKANKALAVLDKMTQLIPNTNLFISMYIRKEALMSSQIEGAQATLEDILDPLIEANTNRNVADVIKYIKATEYALARLKELPLCNRLIKEVHTVLLTDVRGGEKTPGEFRRSQNWIGGMCSMLKNARFIPPLLFDMEEAISDLEKYMNADDSLDTLIRAALIHYQFETIHPFLDGNGRVGRLLITLFLIQKKVLTSPTLYISYFLKKNRIEYYDRLSEVRRTGNYEQWVKFFLQAVYESAEDALTAIEKLIALHTKNESALTKSGRSSANLLRLLNYLEANPIINIAKTASALNLSFNSTSIAVNKLCNTGILNKTSPNRRNRTFSYGAYLEILRDGT